MFDRLRRVSPAAVLVLASAAFADCPPDCNGDGKLNINDFICFQAKWKAHDPYGDYDGSGTYTVNDFIRFQADFASTLAGGGCSSEFTAGELAGNSLGSFPLFAFVNTFNAGSLVSVAVDPAVYSSISGKSTNVYIVANKSASQWAGDKSLTDVRGSSQAVTFGADLASSRFTLTGSGALATGTGTDISKGYDLVVDVNKNGQLDAGDFIDGVGDGPGFWVVKDITSLGGLGVTQIAKYIATWPGLSASFDEERIYYPSDIASRGKLPLVVISHGNGHQYIWYDYVGNHLGSYGYVVMAHQNQTGPGIDSCSKTTLYHTDAFLGQLDVIGGGVLLGHVDSHKIIWIGHSRGGEGVVLAYTKISDGRYVPTNYSLSDIILIDSIAPVIFDEVGKSDPKSANYELLYGSADGDVCGCPGFDLADSFVLYERALGTRHATYLQGADHNDFNCCGFDDFTGPPGTAMGREEVQQVAKASFLGLVKWYAEGDESAREFSWRQFEDLRPIGTKVGDIVDRQFKQVTGATKFVIDDFQSNPSTTVASTGAAVSYTVTNITEALMREKDGTYSWSAADPMNGMAMGYPDDFTKGVVFDWNGAPAYYETAVPAASKDLSAYTFVSLRACQQTQHPYTKAKLEDLTFTVTLRDGAGKSASINIGAYAGGLEEVYQRSGGWQNEFETIRIRLTDFTHGGTGLDLKNVVAVRLDFGPGFGANEGRIGLDDIEVVK